MVNVRLLVKFKRLICSCFLYTTVLVFFYYCKLDSGSASLYSLLAPARAGVSKLRPGGKVISSGIKHILSIMTNEYIYKNLVDLIECNISRKNQITCDVQTLHCFARLMWPSIKSSRFSAVEQEAIPSFHCRSWCCMIYSLQL